MSSKTNKTLFLALLLAIFTACTKVTIYPTPQDYNANNTNLSVSPQKNIDDTKSIKNSNAMHRATMRPYVINGKTYYPTLANVGDRFNGIASWYGPDFHNKKTSNGETYDMYKMTAAHKTLPMNTMVEVINVENQKKIIVRINDRGPFVKDRIIDLSNVAAHQIDMVKKGTAEVIVNVIGFNAAIANENTPMKQKTVIQNDFYIQVGAFSNIEGARDTKRKFDITLEDNYSAIVKKGEVNKVWITGFKSEKEAIDFKKENDLKEAIIIVSE